MIPSSPITAFRVIPARITSTTIVTNCAKKENVYKTPGPNEKNLRDIFSIMVTEDKAIPFGVVAQKVMYNARN